jgi:hypothetical protein
MATRRELLKAGAATGLMALLPSVSFISSAAADRLRPRDQADLLSRSTFRDFLFDDFHVERSGEMGVDLRLVAIRDLGPANGLRTRESEEAFSLRFQGAPSTSLDQGTYTLVHPRLGRVDLFLVPMGGGELPAFEAIINRQIPLGLGRQIAPGRRLGRAAKPRA